MYYVEVGGEGDFTQGTRATGGGFGPLSAGIAPRSSNYYVVCSYWLWANDVTETSDAEDDHPAGTNTNATVEVGSTATGEIERPGDRDWFAVTLQSDKSYRIDLEGRHTSNGTLWDPYLYGIHDSNGNPISGTTNDDGGAGNNSRLYFSPEANGTYYIAAGAYRNRTGTYRVSVSEINNDDYLAGTGTSGTVAVGGSARGEIERAGDRDWFEVTLEAGKRYRIDLEGAYTSAGTLRDPYLRGVHDQNGNLISGTTDDDGGLVRNSRLYFAPRPTAFTTSPPAPPAATPAPTACPSGMSATTTIRAARTPPRRWRSAARPGEPSRVRTTRTGSWSRWKKARYTASISWPGHDPRDAAEPLPSRRP